MTCSNVCSLDFVYICYPGDGQVTAASADIHNDVDASIPGRTSWSQSEVQPQSTKQCAAPGLPCDDWCRSGVCSHWLCPRYDMSNKYLTRVSVVTSISCLTDWQLVSKLFYVVALTNNHLRAAGTTLDRRPSSAGILLLHPVCKL